MSSMGEHWQLRPELEFTEGVDSWNVRASPDFDAVTLCVLKAGHPFAVLRQEGEWLQVLTENKVRGWCYRKLRGQDALVPVGITMPFETNMKPEPPVLQRSRSREEHVAELLSELGEQRRQLEAAQSRQATPGKSSTSVKDTSDGNRDLVLAASAVQHTMAKLELLGIEQEKLLEAESPEALAGIQQVVEDLSQELSRSKSYRHSEFRNPQQESCWLSTFFQSLWHSRVFHALFDSLVRPLPSQGAGSATEALRETWELYERGADSVSVEALVQAWGSGFGDCSEAFAKLQGEPALKPLSDLFATVPVSLQGPNALDPSELWSSVREQGVAEAPLLALDLALPSIASAEILKLMLSWRPSHGGRKRKRDGTHQVDLGDSHSIVAAICFMEACAHYVVFCRRQTDEDSWLFFNDLPGLAKGVRRELWGWAAVAHECARFELRPKVLLYESQERAREAVQQASPTLKASICAAAISKKSPTILDQLLWGLGAFALVVVIAMIAQQVLDIRRLTK